MKSMKKTLGALSGRFAATLGVLATALVLTACGGGGGGAATGGGVTTPPVATPTINLTLGSIALDGKKDVPTSASTTVTVNLAPSNFASSVTTGYTLTGTTTINCNGVQVQSLTTGSTAAADAKTATISVSFTGAPNATTCTVAGTLNATRGGVTSNSLPFTATFTTVAAATACAAPTVSTKLGSTTVCASPVGVVIPDTDFAKIPAGCGEVTHNPLDQCFLDFLPKVKFHETPAKATGAAISPVTNIANDGPVLFGCFIDKFDNTTCKIFLKDTGTIFGNGGVNQSTSHETLQVDRVYGSDKGSVTRIAQTGECFEMSWFPPTTQAGVSSNVWSNTKINCPASLK